MLASPAADVQQIESTAHARVGAHGSCMSGVWFECCILFCARETLAQACVLCLVQGKRWRRCVQFSCKHCSYACVQVFAFVARTSLLGRATCCLGKFLPPSHPLRLMRLHRWALCHGWIALVCAARLGERTRCSEAHMFAARAIGEPSSLLVGSRNPARKGKHSRAIARIDETNAPPSRP